MFTYFILLLISFTTTRDIVCKHWCEKRLCMKIVVVSEISNGKIVKTAEKQETQKAEAC